MNEILNLGHHPPSDAFLSKKDLAVEEIHYPLVLVHCSDCDLVQLNYQVDPGIVFGPKYVYMSGTNKFLRGHLLSIPKLLNKRFPLSKGDLVIDIGSNDGTLLEGYKPFGVRALGVDPSDVAGVAEAKGLHVLRGFFDEDLAARIVKEYGRAKVITATNVIAHVKELHSFLRGVKHLLHEKGTFLTESHYLPSMIEGLQYVEIYLEHLRYYSLSSLSNIFPRFGLELFDAQLVDTHGGSIRVLVSNKGSRPIRPSMSKLAQRERELGLNSADAFRLFSSRVHRQRSELMKLLWRIKGKRQRIVGLAAPAKGNTLLNFCRIGPEILDYIVDLNPMKVGRYTPGMHIEVVEEDRLFTDQPEFGLLLSWDIASTLVPSLRRRGFKGKIILPIPKPRILSDV